MQDVIKLLSTGGGREQRQMVATLALPLAEKEAASPLHNMAAQGLSPFNFRHISSPMTVPHNVFCRQFSFGGVASGLGSQGATPVHGFCLPSPMSCRRPMGGYMDFSTALNDRVFKSPNVPEGSPVCRPDLVRPSFRSTAPSSCSPTHFNLYSSNK